MKPVTDRETLLPLIAGVVIIYLLFTIGQSWQTLFQTFTSRSALISDSPQIIGECLESSVLPSISTNVEVPVTEGMFVPYSDVAITYTNIPNVTMLARWGAGDDGKFTWGQGETAFNDIALSTNLGIVATATGNGIEVRSLANGIRQCNSVGSETTLAADLDSDSLLVTNNTNGKVYLWDLKRNEFLYSFSTPNRYAITEFMPDGKRIIMVDYRGDATFWDVETHQKYHGSAILYDASITDFAFYITPQRGVERIAVVQSDKVRIRRPNGNEFHTLKIGMSHTMVDFAPDGETIASAGAGGVQLWSFKTGEKLWENDTLIGVVNEVVFSPNGEWIAVASSDNILRIWNAIDGTLVAELSGHGGEIHAIEISPDATFMLSASQDGTVAVWGIPAQP